jgi:hypothetical protein
MSRWTALILLVGVAVVAIAGYAIGADKSSKDLVLCATKNGGNLSLATAKGKCAKGEKKLTVAKEGPVGPVGAPGAAGTTASLAPEAIHYVTGTGSDTCFEHPGTFCDSTGGSSEWGNFSGSDPSYGNVGYFKDAAGFVHLTGVASDDSSGGGPGGFAALGPFYLPAGYRPSVIEVFTVPAVTSGTGTTFNAAAIIKVEPSGAVVSPSNTDIIGLSGIAFRP